MPWCPKCKCEFRPGYTVCSECGLPLLSRAEDLEKASGSLSMDKTAALHRLTTVSDSDLLNEIKRLLTDHEIPFLVIPCNPFADKQHFSGSLSRGDSVWIAQQKADLAREIITSYLPGCPLPPAPAAADTAQAAEPETEGDYTERYVRRGQRLLVTYFALLGGMLLLTCLFLLRN